MNASARSSQEPRGRQGTHAFEREGPRQWRDLVAQWRRYFGCRSKFNTEGRRLADVRLTGERVDLSENGRRDRRRGMVAELEVHDIGGAEAGRHTMADETSTTAQRPRADREGRSPASGTWRQ